MADTKRVVQPTEGTQDLGTETTHEDVGRPSAGTDTQLHIAAKGGTKKKAEGHIKDISDNTREAKNTGIQEDFLRADETDE